DPTVSLNQGDLLSLVCAAAFATHICCLEAYTRRGDAVSLFGWQLVFVTLAMLPAMVIESPETVRFTPTAVLMVALIVTGVLATGAFAVQMWAQSIVPAQRVALIFSLEPAFAAWLAWYFLGEQLAGQVLGDFEVPQVGEVSLISFDPHPLLAPHPYIEWFSIRKNHYRIELAPADAWILTGAEAAALDSESGAIRNALGAQVRSTRERAGPDWGV